MTTPEEPGAPDPSQSPYASPPAGGPDPSMPPPYGAPPPPPPYGAPPAYGAPPPPYGAPPAYASVPPGSAPPGWGAPQTGGYAPQPFGQQFGAPPPQGGYATWGSRVLARIIDGLVTLPGLIFVIVGASIGGGAGVGLLLLGYLVILGIAIWNEFIRQGSTGQTIGKQQMHIKLIKEADGQVLGAGFCFVRSLAHVVDGITCYIGYLWPLWDAKKQTFADKICGTIEVNV